MAEHTTPKQDQRSRDAGFTLIEVLIVVVTIGIIATAVSGVIIVTLRTSPATEVRVDDARSVQGLVTWLPQDVDAAPPDGFNRDNSYWPCAGPVPADSHNVLTMEWTEKTAATTNYAATYRYELGKQWTMVRYECTNGGPGTRLNLTSGLPDWNPSTPPAVVEMCQSAVSAGGTCPSGDIIPAADTAPGQVLSMKLQITRLDGVVATIDAAPKNPDQDLADDPNATTNNPPEVAQTNYTLDMFAGQTVTIDLASTHSATDPDGDPISAAIDSTEPIPAGITAVASDPMDLTVTADPSLSPGFLSPYIVMIISDNQAGWVDATVTVRIIPQPNQPPQLSPTNYHLQIEAGQTVVLPLDTTHGAFDPNGDTMRVTVVSYSNPDINAPSPNSPGPLDLAVTAKPSVPVGPVLTPITFEVDDYNGGLVTGTITVEIVAPSTNSAPVASTANVDVNAYAGDSYTFALDASHGVMDPDSDPISVVSSSDPSYAVSTLIGGLDVTIDIDPGAPVGPLASPISFVVEDVYGASVTVTVTIDVIPTPPPPSDCVLTGLSATPSSVDRQGGGSQAHLIKNDVTVTVTYTGSCDGLSLFYDSGDTSGLGVGTGRIFPPGSPSSVVIVGKNNGGTEKFTPATHTLTARTTSAVTPDFVQTTLTVN